MNVIDTTGMSREQWLALRRQSIGASDAPVIAGLSKYKSRFALWLEKTGQVEPEEAGEEARWGLRLEDDIMDEVRDPLGFEAKATQLMIAHPEFPWMTSTIDMIDTDDDFHEFKAVGFQSGKNLEDGNPASLSDAWHVQGAQQMACGDKPRVFFHVFVGGRLKMMNFEMARDEAVIHGLIQLNSEFHRHVEDRTPPTEFDAADAGLLLKYYRAIEGETIHAAIDSRIHGLAEQYERAAHSAKFQSEMADQLKAALLAEMATAPRLIAGQYRMSRSTVNVKAQEPKPRPAYSYTKFTFTNTESDE